MTQPILALPTTPAPFGQMDKLERRAWLDSLSEEQIEGIATAGHGALADIYNLGGSDADLLRAEAHWRAERAHKHRITLTREQLSNVSSMITVTTSRGAQVALYAATDINPYSARKANGFLPAAPVCSDNRRDLRDGREAYTRTVDDDPIDLYLTLDLNSPEPSFEVLA